MKNKQDKVVSLFSSLLWIDGLVLTSTLANVYESASAIMLFFMSLMPDSQRWYPLATSIISSRENMWKACHKHDVDVRNAMLWKLLLANLMNTNFETVKTTLKDSWRINLFILLIVLSCHGNSLIVSCLCWCWVGFIENSCFDHP